MKLSIWYQFSSNHSASYTVVGVFPTAEQAAEMGKALKTLVRDIHTWWKQNHDVHGMSQIEAEAAKLYGIEWEEPIDWLLSDEPVYEPYRRTPDQHIFVQDRLVFVDAPGSLTWQTGHQFAKIMQARAANIFHDVYMGEPPNTQNMMRFANAHFNMRIEGNHTTVQDVYATLKDYLWEPESFSHYQPMPWAIYHDRAEEIHPKLEPENYPHQEELWLRESAARHAFVRGRNTLLGTQSSWTSEERAEYEALSTQDKEVELYIDMLRRETTIYSGRVTMKDAGILLEAARPLYALASLVGWLRALDCEVIYTLQQAEDTTGTVS